MVSMCNYTNKPFCTTGTPLHVHQKSHQQHILERHFIALYDHLGIEMVAMEMMRKQLLEHHNIIQILKCDTFESTSDRSMALSTIISAVKEKGLSSLLHILEQTSHSYSGHQKILTLLQNDPSYIEYL